MSAFAFEYEHAKQEGVQFQWRVIPVRIHSDGSGIRSLECAQARVNTAGVLEAVEGTEFHFDCQQILYAIGQSPLLELLSSVRGIELSHGREVVDAVADGKRAGVAVAQALAGVALKSAEAAHA
jgi:glutamate synthase (NADPH/NADH) small chain